MNLRFHQPIGHLSLDAFSRSANVHRGLQHCWHQTVIVYFLFLTSMASYQPNWVTHQQNVSDSLPRNNGYYCYLRCLAKCVDEIGVSSLDSGCSNRCTSYNNDVLCNKTDSACWSTCRDLTSDNSSVPSTPVNVSVSYTRFPQPSPYEADVRWSIDGNDATLHVVQYIDTTDEFQTWSFRGSGINITAHNRWHFIKPNLCPQYAFRVAAVNRYGVSKFSEIVDLPEPVPLVPTPYYDLVSAELVNKSFPSAPDYEDFEQIWNESIRAVISFAPPTGWDLSKDIVDITADLYPEQSGNHIIGYSPEKRWIKGTSQFELYLPGDTSRSVFFKLMFSVQTIITRCDTNVQDGSTAGYHYPTEVYNPRRGMMLPVYEFELTCQNIAHSECPYDDRETLPSCGVNSVDVETFYDNKTMLVQANVTFDRLLERRRPPLHHYLVAYGDGQDQPMDDGQLVPPTTTNLLSQFPVPPGKLYVIYICGIYVNGSENVDWNLTSRYVIDLTDLAVETEPVVKSDRGSSIALIAAPIAAALTIAAIACVVIKRRTRRESRNRGEAASSAGMIDNEYVEQPRRFTKWEIPRRRLIIHTDEKLGSGAFGAVYKGRVIGELLASANQKQSAAERIQQENCVAVKILPDYADEKSKADFRTEIDIMSQLGHHERLVNMLACITADDPSCLVVEFCDHGDLLRYMRVRKTYMLNLESTGINLNNLRPLDDVDQGMLLSFKDVLSFAWQISVGLEYISQKGYIHRDVAARNILVASGRRLKIGDFGLCRYASQDPVYLGKGGRLPIKWMALEALKSYRFTTKSDVWSFGVLLYELFTLGNTPYPGMEPADMERFLESGRRMSQPPQCPVDLYMVMLSCWQEFPSSRPTFTEIRQILSVMLENISGDYYYTQIRPSLVIDGGRKRTSGEQNEILPQMDECELDDQVFENEPGQVKSANVANRSSSVSGAGPPPPLPPRPLRSRSSLASDSDVVSSSPTARSHQRTSTPPNEEPVLLTGSVSRGRVGYVARYTRSTDLTPVMEAAGTEQRNDSEAPRSTLTSTSSGREHPRLRRRSSAMSAQSSQHD